MDAASRKNQAGLYLPLLYYNWILISKPCKTRGALKFAGRGPAKRAQYNSPFRYQDGDGIIGIWKHTRRGGIRNRTEVGVVREFDSRCGRVIFDLPAFWGWSRSSLGRVMSRNEGHKHAPLFVIDSPWKLLLCARILLKAGSYKLLEDRKSPEGSEVLFEQKGSEKNPRRVAASLFSKDSTFSETVRDAQTRL